MSTRNNPLPEASITIIGNNLILDVFATPSASDQTSNVTTILENGDTPATGLSPMMEHIWETLLKINTSVDKLQRNYMASRVENHAKFVDIEKHMKSLKNFR